MQNFYENKGVFITGGSGFLGKVIIEKLLRKTDVKCIYMLIRSKRGICSTERIKNIFSDPLFEKLRELKPHAHTLITSINGDCSLPNLGISTDDRKMLTTNVNVIIHCAATIRFNEPLYNALLVNVAAVKHLLEIAKHMTHLKTFVHVSTAFTNCILSHIEEKFYPENIVVTADKALKLAEQLGPELTNSLSAHLLRNFPNTYTFTKTLAEDLILNEADTLPLCIFRPAIITSTYAEPIPGWVDNFAGAMGTLMAIAQGILRVLYIENDIGALLVPVDFCANAILSCGYTTGQQNSAEKEKREPKIYNFVPDEKNTITWGSLTESTVRYARKYPISNIFWYPFTIKVNSVELEYILSFFLHIIPGYFYDLLLAIRGDKAIMVRMHQKLQQLSQVLNYFKKNKWTHSTANTNTLWESLTSEDKLNYNFNMSGVMWKKYLKNFAMGIRRYLAMENDETIPKAIKRCKTFQWAHNAILTFITTGISLLLFMATAYCLQNRYFKV